MTERTVLIDATIDRVDTDLICAEAGRDPTLYRLSIGDRCYFVDAKDIDDAPVKLIGRLSPGMKVTVCVGEQRGRRKISWLRGADVSIAPRDVRSEMRWAAKLLAITLCVQALAIVMGVWMNPSSMVVVSIIIVGVGVLVDVFGAATLINSLDARRRAAQRSWSQP